MKSRTIILSIGSLLLALLLLWVGMSIPRHFRAVSPLVLAEAGEDTMSLTALADDALARGQVGLVQLYWRARPDDIREGARERYQRLTREHPLYNLTGGPSPYLEQLWAGENLADWRDQPILPLLLPQARRDDLRAFLQESTNQTVEGFLETGELSGWQMFMPVYSAGGQPLDATILLAGLLEQAQVWNPELSTELREVTQMALMEDPQALAELEETYFALLTLGMRLKWVPLQQLVERAPDLETLQRLAVLLHQEEIDVAVLTSAVLLADDLPGVVDYLEENPQEGPQALATTLEWGRGATQLLLRFDKGLYQPPAWVDRFSALGEGARKFKGFTEARPSLALFAKLCALFGGGYLLAMLLLRPIEGSVGKRRTTFGRILLEGGHFTIALVVAVLLAVAAEPALMNFQANENARLTLNLNKIAPQLANVTPTDNGFIMFDQVTLIILLLFFVLQLATFIYCVLKIREIKGRNVPPETKIRLLDNEETLFDLGLYIGIAGTVSSLILVVLKLVDASLMAAYASTLFGIIFVALLKVFFLRPFRRGLILESQKIGHAISTPVETV
ncbi:MAG: hypothetical protein E1N59_848 [Puniceicoccaceae bacterium 5H]|nr:MAG: hypothetical protein E1N59_848 [Puniceicoccaceae bacterium 5H]